MQSVDNFLHIYSQQSPHSEAYIVGDVESLTSLRDAIDRTIVNKYGSTGTVYSQDGEGYNIIIINSTRQDLMLPYSDSDLRVEYGVHPYKLLTPEVYRSLMTSECGV